MKRNTFDIILSWGNLITGVIHSSTVFYFADTRAALADVPMPPWGPRFELELWWVSGGEALIFGGMINLLRTWLVRDNLNVLKVCVITNVIMLLYEIWLVVHQPALLALPRESLLVGQIFLLVFSIIDLRAKLAAPDKTAPIPAL